MPHPLPAQRLHHRRLDAGGTAVWICFFKLQNHRRKSRRENFSRTTVAHLREHNLFELRNIRRRPPRRLERLEKAGGARVGALRGVQQHRRRRKSGEPARLDKTVDESGGVENNGEKSPRRRGWLESGKFKLNPQSSRLFDKQGATAARDKNAAGLPKRKLHR